MKTEFVIELWDSSWPQDSWSRPQRTRVCFSTHLSDRLCNLTCTSPRKHKAHILYPPRVYTMVIFQNTYRLGERAKRASSEIFEMRASTSGYRTDVTWHRSFMHYSWRFFRTPNWRTWGLGRKPCFRGGLLQLRSGDDTLQLVCERRTFKFYSVVLKMPHNQYIGISPCK